MAFIERIIGKPTSTEVIVNFDGVLETRHGKRSVTDGGVTCLQVRNSTAAQKARQQFEANLQGLAENVAKAKAIATTLEGIVKERAGKKGVTELRLRLNDAQADVANAEALLASAQKIRDNVMRSYPEFVLL